jgi:hypothetical protein
MGMHNVELVRINQRGQVVATAVPEYSDLVNDIEYMLYDYNSKSNEKYSDNTSI